MAPSSKVTRRVSEDRVTGQNDSGAGGSLDSRVSQTFLVLSSVISDVTVALSSSAMDEELTPAKLACLFVLKPSPDGASGRLVPMELGGGMFELAFF